MSRTLFILSLACYLVSFALPTFTIIYGYEGVTEINVGREAFLVCLCNGYNLDGTFPFVLWLANPAYWTGVVLWFKGRKGYAAVASGVAIAFGMWGVARPQILVGYYVWLGSFTLLLAAGIAEQESKWVMGPAPDTARSS